MQALFSEHWHLVRHLKPQLRGSVRALPRTLRGQKWVLLHDEFTHKFIRLTVYSWQVIALMDGVKTVEDIWEMACSSKTQYHTDESEYQVIGQHDLVNILSQLYQNDMLVTQVSADASEMFNRFKKQKMNRLKQSYLNPLSIKVPLFYPDKWFKKHQLLAQNLFSIPVLLIWLAVVFPAGLLMWQNWQAITVNFSDRVLAMHNLFILWLTYPFVKMIHEWAHGMAVKKWHGHVREIGILFILFMPIPYVDASSSYRFPSKWQRATVASAGIMAELLLGALAVYTWLSVESGVVRAFAFNIILISAVSTVLVNGNPLMKYDGYYILTDLLEIPNLSQRAKEYWIYLSDRFLFGSRDTRAPMGSEGEKFWLSTYGAIAPIYRIVIMLSLTWFIAQKYFFFGILLALVSLWLSFIMPIYKAIKHVISGNSLIRYRSKAIKRLYGGIIVVLLFLFCIPVPFYSMQQGVVWLPEEAIVRTHFDGHVIQHHIKPQAPVQAGTKILTLNHLSLQQELKLARERIDALSLQIRQVQNDLAKMQTLMQQKIVEEKKFIKLQSDVSNLTIKSMVAGYWYPVDMKQPEGQFVKKGTILGYVVQQHSDIIRVAVEQNDMKWIEQRLHSIQVRQAMDVTTEYHGTLSRITPKGDFQLTSPALSIEAGGNIVTNIESQTKNQALDRVFDVDVTIERPQNSLEPLVFGQRVYVRFHLGYTPLAWQWLLRLKQLFLKELNV